MAPNLLVEKTGIMAKFPAIAFIAFVLVACTSDATLTEPVTDARLKSFFDAFVQEGQRRGRVVRMNDLSGNIVPLDGGTHGRCNQFTSGTKQVLVDSAWWNRATDLEKEYVIFHELGHCALDRRHLDTRNADGTCASMMQSGNGVCRMLYAARNRRIYLDELFLQ